MGIGEELAGQGDHALDEIRLDQGAADVALAAGIRAHRAIGEQQRHRAIRREVVEHVLDPGEVGIPLRRRAVFPAGVALQLAVPPFLDVKGRIRHHEVGAEVRVLVAGEGVRRFLAEVEIDAADGHVHRRQPPGGGIAFLPEDHDVADAAAVLLDEALGLHEEAAGAHRRVIDAALIGLDHFHDEADDGLGREVLAALFPLRQGELAEEVFVNVAEDVLRVKVRVLERDGGDEVDEPREVRRIDLELGVVLVEDVLELRVLLLHRLQRVVDELAGGGDLVFRDLAVFHRDLGPGRELGGILQGLPPRQRRHPEDVLLDVVVALLQFGTDAFLVGTRFLVFLGIDEEVVFRVLQHRLDLRLPLGEGIRDVFEEDQAKDGVLVNSGVEIGPELVGGGPELFVELAEKRLGIGGRHVGGQEISKWREAGDIRLSKSQVRGSAGGGKEKMEREGPLGSGDGM